MDNTLKSIHGEEIAKTYEDLQNKLLGLNKTYDYKDAFGNPINATSFFHYTIEPTNLYFHDDIATDLKNDVKLIFDNHFTK